MTETVRFRGVELCVEFDYEGEEKATEYSPSSPESVEITSVRAQGDIAEALGSDALEEIAKLVLLRKKEG